MATARLNSALRALHGAVDGWVYKHYGDKIVVTRVPKFSGKWSKKQKAGRSEFKQASNYAVKVYASPQRKADYAAWAKKRRRTIRSIAMSDFCSQPDIGAITTTHYTGVGDSYILINAVDGFKVVAMSVVLRAATGAVIEKGPAVHLGGFSWEYRTTRTTAKGALVTIAVTARDRLGKKVTKTVSATVKS